MINSCLVCSSPWSVVMLVSTVDANGEAIYGTRSWKISSEGPTKVVSGSFNDTATKPYTSRDIRFTARDGLLYATAFAWTQDGKIRIESLARGSKLMESEIAGGQMLGSGDKLKWTRDNDGLEIELPAGRTGEFARLLLPDESKLVSGPD